MKATTTCPECDTKYTITSASVESVQYCPFCGAAAALPYDDMDDGESDRDEDEF